MHWAPWRHRFPKRPAQVDPPASRPSDRRPLGRATDQREIRRKLRVLEYAELSRDVSKPCRYFGIGRASFYPWRYTNRTQGEPGLANKRSVQHNHPNKTPTAVEEKVLHLHRKHHLDPMRIVWSLATLSRSTSNV
jgi:hypothetical protein